MLNRDINSRFEDWLLNPSETLDFEVKQWLDLDEVEAQGLVAKALIALENHGGGFLLFGYRETPEKRLEPDPARPSSLQQYTTDVLNAIIKRRAEPAFNVEVTLQRHPESGLEYPLVRVHGQSKVPVRSDSSTPGNSLRQHTYYIRAAGPESRSPKTAAEWDGLLRRSIANQREEIVALFRAFSPALGLSASTPEPSASDLLNAFVDAAVSRWQVLNESLPQDHRARVSHGRYQFAARLIGDLRQVSGKDIVRAVEAARRYTGWPAFVTLHQEQTRPKTYDGGVEAWLAHTPHPDVSNADFWRIDQRGDFFSLRGYEEDSPLLNRGSPGGLFEATLPIWRLGEFLLRISEIGRSFAEEGSEPRVLVRCEWLGLEGRQLFINNGRRFLGGRYISARDTVRTEGTFESKEIVDVLPEIARVLLKPLYESFYFFSPPETMYTEELGEMRNGRHY